MLLALLCYLAGVLHAFYVPDFSPSAPALSAEEGFHAHKVLRIRIGESLLVLDGKGSRYLCTLLSTKSASYDLSVEKSEVIEPPPRLQLIVAPPKQASRLEWLVEKSAEIGVDRLCFVHTERSERKTVSLSRLQRIAISALKQSQQPYLLQMQALQPLAGLFG